MRILSSNRDATPPRVCRTGRAKGALVALNWQSLWDFEHPEVSERRFREAAAATDDMEERRLVETQIARALGLQGRFDEAHRMLDCVDNPDAQVQPLTRIYIALERGRLFN